MFEAIQGLHNNLKARFASFWRKREIVRVAKTLHMQDLATASPSLHPLIRAQQAVELQAIRAGKLTVLNRRTLDNTGLPFQFTRVNQPVAKSAPISLRRFSRTPVPARAINLVKAGLMGLNWEVRAVEGVAAPEDKDVKQRIRIAKNVLMKPNHIDSHMAMQEKLITDFLVYGMAAAEVQPSMNPERPVMYWAVNAETIQVVPNWTEDKRDTMPRYAQVAPGQNEAAPILLMDDEMMVILDNVATDIPFGTGCLEIAFQMCNYLMGAQRMAGLAGQEALGRTVFWWNGSIPAQTAGEFRSYLQSELEGMARVGMINGATKPDVIDIAPITIDMLMIPWHEMCIRMIANAFNMSPQVFGLERDVNRSTSENMSDQDFRSSVIPIAKKFSEAMTRSILHKGAGWEDVEMVYLGLEDPDIETKLEIVNARYAASACTPNDLNRALGIPPINSPLADITMAEFLLLQTDLQSAAKAAAAPPPVDPNDPNAPADPDQDWSGDTGPKSGGGSGPAKMPSVKKPAVPGIKRPMVPKVKRPTAPSAVKASRVATMSVAQIKAYQAAGALPQSGIDVAEQADQEEPGILSKMPQQVWDYIEQLAKHELENEETTKGAQKLNKKWTKLAEKRYRKAAKRAKGISPASLNASGHRGQTQQNVKGSHSSRRATKPGLSY